MLPSGARAGDGLDPCAFGVSVAREAGKMFFDEIPVVIPANLQSVLEFLQPRLAFAD